MCSVDGVPDGKFLNIGLVASTLVSNRGQADSLVGQAVKTDFDDPRFLLTLVTRSLQFNGVEFVIIWRDPNTPYDGNADLRIDTSDTHPSPLSQFPRAQSPQDMPQLHGRAWTYAGSVTPRICSRIRDALLGRAYDAVLCPDSP